MITSATQPLRQPKALYLLAAVKMWECFSFYGMRALMVLYLIHQLGLEDSRAYGIYALYGSLFEFGGILGGCYADRLFGLRKSIVIGGWMIAAGHLCLTWQTHSWPFFAGLALIIVGSALFSGNISALLGTFFEEGDPRRESGFTLFYMGINIGAFLASLLCGWIGEAFGWHYGFGLAGLGMIAGNLLFLWCRPLLEGKGELLRVSVPLREKILGNFLVLIAVPICGVMIVWENVFMQVIPLLFLSCLLFLGRKMVLSGSFSTDKLMSLGVYLIALALFFAAEDQTASALLVFSERYATETIFGWSFPTTALLALNPFVIILGGFVLSRFQTTASSSQKLVSAGLFLAAAVFAMLAVACHFPNREGFIPLAVVASAIIAISVGEVLVGPAIYAYCSEAAPKEWLGTTMGLLPLGFALGNVLSGFFSKSIAVGDIDVAAALTLYSEGFLKISSILGLVAIFILVVQVILKKRTGKELMS